MSTLTLDRPLARPIARTIDRPMGPLSESELDAMLRPVVAGAPRSRVRLTRRGRLVVFVVSLLLAFAVGILISAGSVAFEPHHAQITSYTATHVERRNKRLYSNAL